jgi:hypothetical protein
MFERINFKLKEAVDFERLKGDIVTAYGNPPRPRLTYYRCKDYEYLKSILPDEMPWGKIPPLQVQVAEIADAMGGHLLPHIDHNISACANLYITSNGSTTHFYNLKTNGQGFVYPGRQTANIFLPDQVDKVTEFKANDGEMYLLNVSEIHSVETPQPGIRQFITWQWVGIPFEEVRASLKQNQPA